MRKTQFIALSGINNLAKKVAAQLKGGEILALIGPLGAGKTTFVKALAKQLKIKHRVTSPTFTLLHRYNAKIAKRPIFLYHLDLYRTKNFREVKTLGVEEFWGRPEAITLIEWADKIKRHWPKKTFVINFIDGERNSPHKNKNG